MFISGMNGSPNCCLRTNDPDVRFHDLVLISIGFPYVAFIHANNAYLCQMLKHILMLMLLLVPTLNKVGSGHSAPVMDRQFDLYTTLKLAEKGLPVEVFGLALKGYKKLESEGKLLHAGILTIADFSQSSKNKRFYVIDLKNASLLFNTYVAHGRNTGEEFATRFSNLMGSYQSSLGFFITKEKVRGANVGLSLILDGVEKGFNDNALKRAIVIHGATYATENFIRKTGRLGRSYGCPSLPPELVGDIVETIKESTCLFIYHRDEIYLRKSSLLN